MDPFLHSPGSRRRNYTALTEPWDRERQSMEQLNQRIVQRDRELEQVAAERTRLENESYKQSLGSYNDSVRRIGQKTGVGTFSGAGGQWQIEEESPYQEQKYYDTAYQTGRSNRDKASKAGTEAANNQKKRDLSLQRFDTQKEHDRIASEYEAEFDPAKRAAKEAELRTAKSKLDTLARKKILADAGQFDTEPDTEETLTKSDAELKARRAKLAADQAVWNKSWQDVHAERDAKKAEIANQLWTVQHQPITPAQNREWKLWHDGEMAQTEAKYRVRKRELIDNHVNLTLDNEDWNKEADGHNERAKRFNTLQQQQQQAAAERAKANEQALAANPLWPGNDNWTDSGKAQPPQAGGVTGQSEQFPGQAPGSVDTPSGGAATSNGSSSLSPVTAPQSQNNGAALGAPQTEGLANGPDGATQSGVSPGKAALAAAAGMAVSGGASPAQQQPGTPSIANQVPDRQAKLEAASAMLAEYAQGKGEQTVQPRATAAPFGGIAAGGSTTSQEGKQRQRAKIQAALKEAGVNKDPDQILAEARQQALAKLRTPRGLEIAGMLEGAVRESQKVSDGKWNLEGRKNVKAKVDAALNKFMEVPEAERDQALREIYASASEIRDQDSLTQFGRRVLRMAAETVTSSTSALSNLQLQDFARAKSLYWLDPKTDPMSVTSAENVNVNRTPHAIGAADPESALLIPDAKPLTGKELAHVQGLLRQEEQRRIASMNLKDTARSAIDKGPLDDSWLGQGALGAADMIGLIAPLAVAPPGTQFPVMSATFGGMAYNRRMAKGYDPGLNLLVSAIGGPADAQIERMSGWFSKTPVGTASVAKKILMPSEILESWIVKKYGHTAVGRGSAFMVDKVLGEYGEEIWSQVNQTAGDAFMESMPGVNIQKIEDFKNEWKQFGAATPSMLLGMAIVGSPGAVVHGLRGGNQSAADDTKAALSDADLLRALGVADEATRTQIVELAKTDPIEALKAFKASKPDMKSADAQAARQALDQAAREKFTQLTKSSFESSGGPDAAQPTPVDPALAREQEFQGKVASGDPEQIAQAATVALHEADPKNNTSVVAPEDVAAAQRVFNGDVSPLLTADAVAGNPDPAARPVEVARRISEAAKMRADIETAFGNAKAEAEQKVQWANEQAVQSGKPELTKEEAQAIRDESTDPIWLGKAVVQLAHGVQREQLNSFEKGALDRYEKAGGEVFDKGSEKATGGVPILTDSVRHAGYQGIYGDTPETTDIAKASGGMFGANQGDASRRFAQREQQRVATEQAQAEAAKQADEAAIAARGPQALKSAAEALYERQQKGTLDGPQAEPTPQEQAMSREAGKFPGAVSIESQYKARLKTLAPLLKTRFTAADVTELEAINSSLRGKGSPLAINGRGELVVDWERVRGMSPEEAGQLARHELKHLAQLIALDKAEVEAVWGKLSGIKEGRELQAQMRRAYNAKRISDAETRLTQAREKGDQKATAAIERAIKAIESGTGIDTYNDAMEGLLLLINDPNHTHELVGIAERGGFLDTVKTFLRNLNARLRIYLGRVTKAKGGSEVVAAIREQVARTERVLKELDAGEADFSGLPTEDVGVLLSAPDQSRVIRKPDSTPYETVKKATAAAGYYKLGKKSDGAWHLREVHEGEHFKGYEIVVGAGADVSKVATPEQVKAKRKSKPAAKKAPVSDSGQTKQKPAPEAGKADLTMPAPKGESKKEAPKTEGERRADSIAKAKTFRTTPEVSRVFKADPLIAAVINDHGGIVSKSQAPRNAKRSLWDDAPTLANPTHNAIYRKGGMMPDQMAQALYEQGLIDSPDVPTMWSAIGQASDSAARVMRQNTKRKQLAEEGERQARKFSKDAFQKEPGTEPVTSMDLWPGDEVELDNAKLKVTKVDLDGTVTLEDGQTYGVQEIVEGDVIWAEKVKPGPRKADTSFAPEEAPAKKQDFRNKDFLDATGQDSGFRLTGEKAQATKFEEPDNRTEAEKDAEAGQTRLDQPATVREPSGQAPKPVRPASDKADSALTPAAIAKAAKKAKSPEVKLAVGAFVARAREVKQMVGKPLAALYYGENLNREKNPQRPELTLPQTIRASQSDADRALFVEMADAARTAKAEGNTELHDELMGLLRSDPRFSEDGDNWFLRTTERPNALPANRAAKGKQEMIEAAPDGNGFLVPLVREQVEAKPREMGKAAPMIEPGSNEARAATQEQNRETVKSLAQRRVVEPKAVRVPSETGMTPKDAVAQVKTAQARYDQARNALGADSPVMSRDDLAEWMAGRDEADYQVRTAKEKDEDGKPMVFAQVVASDEVRESLTALNDAKEALRLAKERDKATKLAADPQTEAKRKALAKLVQRLANGEDVESQLRRLGAVQDKEAQPTTYDPENHVLRDSPKDTPAGQPIRIHEPGWTHPGYGRIYKAVGNRSRSGRLLQAPYSGEGANMDQFRRDSLEAAKAMAAAGKSSEEIRAVTGWFPGRYDGKMRFELPSDEIKLKPALVSLRNGSYEPRPIKAVTYRKDGDLWDILMVPPNAKRTADFVSLSGVPREVAAAVVPGSLWADMNLGKGAADYIGNDFKDAKTLILQKPENFGGMNALPLDLVLDHPAFFKAYPEAKDIMVRVDPMLGTGGSLGWRGKEAVITTGLGQQAETMIHEVQHWIQDKESFARGTSVQTVMEEQRQREKAKREIRELPEVKQWLREQEEIVNTASDEDIDAKLLEHVEKAPQVLKDSWARRDTRLEMMSPVEIYRLSAGEIEARDASARMDYTEEQRKATEPYSSENIHPDDAIVMFGEDRSRSGRLLLAPESEANEERLAVERSPMAQVGRVLFRPASLEEVRLTNESETLPKVGESGMEHTFKNLEKMLHYEASQLSDLIPPTTPWHQPEAGTSLLDYLRKFYSPEGIALLKKTFAGETAPEWVENKARWKAMKDELDIVATGNPIAVGKAVLSGNRKTGEHSWDFALSTCLPTTRCSVCYATSANDPRTTALARVRHTLATALYPQKVGEGVAAFVKSKSKGELPFLRVNGAGDISLPWQAKAVNAAIRNLDRPVHIFSRSHKSRAEGAIGLDAISNGHYDESNPGNGVAVYKMGSIDSQLVEEYGIPWIKENLDKRGIINSYLVGDVADIPILEQLRDNGVFFVMHINASKPIIKALDQAGLLGTTEVMGRGEESAPACPCATKTGPFLNGCATCLVGGGPCFAMGSQIAMTPAGTLFTYKSLAERGAPRGFKLVPMSFVGTPYGSSSKARAVTGLQVAAKAYKMAAANLRGSVAAAKRKVLEGKNPGVKIENPRSRETILLIKNPAEFDIATSVAQQWDAHANYLVTDVADAITNYEKDVAEWEGVGAMDRAVARANQQKTRPGSDKSGSSAGNSPQSTAPQPNKEIGSTGSGKSQATLPETALNSEPAPESKGGSGTVLFAPPTTTVAQPGEWLKEDFISDWRPGTPITEENWTDKVQRDFYRMAERYDQLDPETQRALVRSARGLAEMEGLPDGDEPGRTLAQAFAEQNDIAREEIEELQADTAKRERVLAKKQALLEKAEAEVARAQKAFDEAEEGADETEEGDAVTDRLWKAVEGAEAKVFRIQWKMDEDGEIRSNAQDIAKLKAGIQSLENLHRATTQSGGGTLLRAPESGDSLWNRLFGPAGEKVDFRSDENTTRIQIAGQDVRGPTSMDLGWGKGEARPMDASMTSYEAPEDLETAQMVLGYSGTATEARRISGISVPDELKGRGLGQALYLAHFQKYPSTLFYNSQASAEAAGALRGLDRKGLVKLYSDTETGDMGSHAAELTEKGAKVPPNKLIKNGGQARILFAPESEERAFKLLDEILPAKSMAQAVFDPRNWSSEGIQADVERTIEELSKEEVEAVKARFQSSEKQQKGRSDADWITGQILRTIDSPTYLSQVDSFRELMGETAQRLQDKPEPESFERWMIGALNKTGWNGPSAQRTFAYVLASVTDGRGIGIALDTPPEQALRIAARHAGEWAKQGKRLGLPGGATLLRAPESAASERPPTNLPTVPGSQNPNQPQPLAIPTPQNGQLVGGGNAFNVFGHRVNPMWQATENRRWDDFIYTWQNRKIDTERVVADINQAFGITQLPDAIDPALLDELRGQRAEKRTQDFVRTEAKPLLKDMEQSGVSLGQMWKFLLMRHVPEANTHYAQINPAFADVNQNPGSSIRTQDALDYMANLTPAERTRYQRLARRWDRIIAGTQRYWVATGQMTQGDVDAMNATYQHYVPLSREEADWETSGVRGMGTGGGIQTRGPMTMRRTGSATRQVENGLPVILAQRDRAIAKAESARAGRAVYGLAVRAPNPLFWRAVDPMAIADPIAAGHEFAALGWDPMDVTNILQESRQGTINPTTGQVVYRINTRARSNPNVLTVRFNGRDRFVFFNAADPRATRMVAALRNLDIPEMGLLTKVSGAITRFNSMMNTKFSPEFPLTNFFRDIQDVQVNLLTTPIAGEQAQVMRDALPAVRGIYRHVRAQRGGKVLANNPWGGLMDQFESEGGKISFRSIYENNEARMADMRLMMDPWGSPFGKAVTAGGKFTKPAEVVRGLFRLISDVNEAVENGVRLAVFKAALDNGQSPARAAAIAKNISVNFEKKGRAGYKLGAFYAFANANIQGVARAGRTIRRFPLQIIGGGIALGAIQSVMLALAGYDDDDPPEFVREKNWILPHFLGELPGVPGDKSQYGMIPMGYGFSILPNIGRKMTDAILGKVSPTEAATSMISLLFDLYNPTGGGAPGLYALAPTPARPLVSIATNEDWTGKPITQPEFNPLDPKPPQDRAKDTATWLGKNLSKWMNQAMGGSDYRPATVNGQPVGLTPDQIDFIGKEYLGGPGRFVTKVSQAVEAKRTGEELPTYKIPFAGRFYGETGRASGISSEFYENIKTLNGHDRELKGLREDKKPLGEYLKAHPEARLSMPQSDPRTGKKLPSQADTAYSTLGKLKKAKTKAVESGEREKVKAIETQIGEVMQTLNDKVKAAREGK
jgi:hypothetical protein